MMKRMHPEHHITNYVDVKSVDEYSSKIESLGGKIIVPKTPVPGAGYFAACLDLEHECEVMLLCVRKYINIIISYLIYLTLGRNNTPFNDVPMHVDPTWQSLPLLHRCSARKITRLHRVTSRCGSHCRAEGTLPSPYGRMPREAGWCSP
jgi:hypothetical protein